MIASPQRIFSAKVETDRDHPCQGLARNNVRGFLGDFLQRQVQIVSSFLAPFSFMIVVHGVLLVILFLAYKA